MKANNNLISAEDVAKLLQFTVGSIYRMARRGAIPAPLRIGGRLRWSRDELERWIADRAPRPPRPRRVQRRREA